MLRTTVKARNVQGALMAITCASEAVASLKPAIPKHIFGTQEAFVVVALDAKNVPIGRPIMVALGTATSVAVHPRDVFRIAVKRNAVSVIVGHNHPSGDPEPSQDDRALTGRLVSAGDILGITVLDHLVMAAGQWVSFQDRGML